MPVGNFHINKVNKCSVGNFSASLIYAEQNIVPPRKLFEK